MLVSVDNNYYFRYRRFVSQSNLFRFCKLTYLPACLFCSQLANQIPRSSHTRRNVARLIDTCDSPGPAKVSLSVRLDTQRPASPRGAHVERSIDKLNVGGGRKWPS